ncbi:MAG: hypothetical protein KDE56_11090 [Anaerolineales bacterium]|nr:hypothetical protein [Anaerolineales bacterium]
MSRSARDISSTKEIKRLCRQVNTYGKRIEQKFPNRVHDIKPGFLQEILNVLGDLEARLNNLEATESTGVSIIQIHNAQGVINAAIIAYKDPEKLPHYTGYLRNVYPTLNQF